jgi:hypothetical protein
VYNGAGVEAEDTMPGRVTDSGRGVLLVAVIVAINFLIALHVTGLSYGRYDWTVFGVSYQATPTATATATATATPTPTLVPNGGDCTVGSQCASSFCVDGVCCNTACLQGRCDLPGQEGICVIPAAAPALRPPWLVFAVLLLALIGGLALRARLRGSRVR